MTRLDWLAFAAAAFTGYVLVRAYRNPMAQAAWEYSRLPADVVPINRKRSYR